MTVEDETHKRPFPDATDTASSCKRPKHAVTKDGNPDAVEDDVLLSWLTLEDEDVAQLMGFLSPSPPPTPATAAHQDNTLFLSFKVRFAENPRYNSRLGVIHSSSFFITVDLNEESCGSSFSELESSVMASFDTCGAGFGGEAWVASPSDRASWYAWTGISSGGEEVVV